MKTPTVPLGEVCDFVRGITFPSGEGKATPFENSIACLTTSGVQREVAWRSRRFVRDTRLGSEKQVLRAGDILISTANSKELVGKSCLLKKPPFRCTFGAFVTLVRSRAELDFSYLAMWMKTERFLAWCFQNSSNTTNISNLRVSELAELEIPLPDLAKQRQIAATLEQADRLRRTRRYALELGEKLLLAAFRVTFGLPWENQGRFSTELFAEIGTLDRGRSQHRPRNAPHLYGGPYPFVQTGDVANSEGHIRQYTQTYSEAGLAQSRLWKKGTLCITIAANIADTAVLDFDACFPDSIVGFMPGPRVTVEYVHYWLNFTQAYLQKIAPESAQKNINLEILGNLRLAVPPLPLQQRFAALVARHERLRARHREALRQADHLFQTLLHRAFAGA